MLGIGEKTRVEDITVYFDLTDKLGNTATNVSKHKVIFDTNKYINVIAPPDSSPQFSEKTEKIDGENTLIYSNDKTVVSGDKTVYYSFEFKIKEDATNCKNLFRVIKMAENNKDAIAITDGYNIAFGNFGYLVVKSNGSKTERGRKVELGIL